MMVVESNSAIVSLQGCFSCRFFQALDPNFNPPHSLAFIRIVRLLEKAVFREYKRIIADNVLLYGTNFVSTNSDF
jgi:hypothetical protein